MELNTYMVICTNQVPRVLKHEIQMKYEYIYISFAVEREMSIEKLKK